MVAGYACPKTTNSVCRFIENMVSSVPVQNILIVNASFQDFLVLFVIKIWIQSDYSFYFLYIRTKKLKI